MKLPKVVILATGGTIAGRAENNTQMTGYKAGDINIQALINAVPEINNIADIKAEQIANIDSKDMTSEIWLKLAKRCNSLLADDNIKGIVITHGTDTMEETAYFLNLTVHSKKPVILTGAMRPATAISADGPLNLLNAVKLSISPKALGKGVLVTMNDEIFSARDVTKSNTCTVSAFTAGDFGRSGYLSDGDPVFYCLSTRKHTFNSEFDVKDKKTLPYVEIVCSHADGCRNLIEAVVNNGTKGIIYAGTGNGSIHKNDEDPLFTAQQNGVVIVRSSIVGNGRVVPSEKIWEEHHFIKGDTFKPQKARILLQLALCKTNNPKEIQRIFNEY